MGRVIGRLALVASCDNDRRLARRVLLSGKRVKSDNLARLEAVGCRIGCQCLGECFAGTAVAAVQNSEGDPVVVSGRGLLRGMLVSLTTADRARKVLLNLGRGPAFSQAGANVEVLGLDGQSSLDLKVVARIVHLEIEVLKESGDNQLRLLPRERSSDATSGSIAKGLPSSRRKLFKLLVKHALGFPLLCIGAVNSGIAVHAVQSCEHRLALLHMISSAYDLTSLSFRSDCETGCGWLQA